MVPAEVEVRVGATRAGVGEHAGVRDHRPRRVGLLEGAVDRVVEDGLVPPRQLLGGDERRDQRGGVGERARLGVEPEGLVVTAPDGDRRMMAEEVDELPRLAHRLLAHAARVTPLQRHVLPDEQAGLVGGVVELGPGDVGVDAQEVEPGRLRQLDVARQLRRRRLGQLHARRAVIGALEEEALAVDAQHPSLHPHLPQADPQAALVAEPAARCRLDPHLVQRL